MPHDELPRELLTIVSDARTATLATIRPDGGPRLVPICFVVSLPPGSVPSRLVAHSPLDEKPKSSSDPHRLARVADILERPRVELLVERWDEDWRWLAWIRLDGTASLLEAGERSEERAAALEALRVKYPQYRAHRLEERPLLRIQVERIGWWSAEG